MTKAKNIEFRLSKLEKGPDENVLAIMEIRSRAIAGSLLKQISCHEVVNKNWPPR